MCLDGSYDISLIANNSLNNTIWKKKYTLEKNILCCNKVNAKASINTNKNAY